MVCFYVLFIVVTFQGIHGLNTCVTDILGTQYGYMLANNSFKILTDYSFFLCMKECSQFKLCVSINYMDKKECHLNAFTSQSSPDNFVQQQGSIYISKFDFQKVYTKACQNTNCALDERCIQSTLSGNVCIKQELPLICGEPPATTIQTTVNVSSQHEAIYTCANRTGHTAIQHCPVSTCTGIFNWTKPTLSCSENDCFTPDGSYTGKVTCTVHGIPCQNWTDDKPHKSSFKRFGNNTYCRPSEDYEPWCYTLNSTLRWDYCPVPAC